MATTITQSLNIGLPQYPYSLGPGTSDLKKGSYTEATHPAVFAIARDPNNRWAVTGQQFHTTVQPARTQQFAQLLQANANQPALAAAVAYANSFINGQAFLPEVEGNIAHNNEADVVRSAVLYLIHPVAQALWALPDYFGTFASQSEDTDARTRTDLTFYKVVNNQRHRDVAVVEFKRRGWIAGGDFDHAGSGRLHVPAANAQNPRALFQTVLTPFVANTQNAAQHQAWMQTVPAAFNAVMTASQLQPGTNVFTRNALNHIKQAAAYSILHRTRYVALFNYDYLVLCYFPWLDTTRDATVLRANNQQRQDYPVETDVYPLSVRNPQTGATVPNPEVRLALLGFLHDAMMNTP